MADTSSTYPVSLSVDYPEKLDKLTTFFRIFTVIPIFIILSLLAGGSSQGGGGSGWSYHYGAAGFVLIPLVLMLLFRQKYPR